MGGDDLALGENHVSPVQEGEGRMGLWAQPPSPLPIAGKIYPSCVPAPPAFPPTTQSNPCPMTGWGLGPANRSGGGWPGRSNGARRPHSQVKTQCRKGIPSALRARCWPLLCGAHVCQKNSPDIYQVTELAGVPATLFQSSSPL